MRVFVFVNRIQEIGFRQTTSLLIAALLRQDHEVFLASVTGLSIRSQSRKTGSNSLIVYAKSVRIGCREKQGMNSRLVSDFANQVNESDLSWIDLQTADVILIRTNPGRDLNRSVSHHEFLELCQVAISKGIRVVNNPERLAFFSSKASVAILPSKYRPEMLVTNDLEKVLQFVREAKCDSVVKPLRGSRGNNVIRLRPDSRRSQRSLIREFESQTVVVQHFVDSDERGDKRVISLNGKLIEHLGHIAGIHRIPAKGEFRANLHKGGSASPLTLTDEQRESAQFAATMLHSAGIQLAGIDLVGDKVIEFNVFSTGGLFDSNRFAKFDFEEVIIRELATSASCTGL